MATYVTNHVSLNNVGSRVEETAPLYTDYATAATEDGEWINMSGVEQVSYIVNGITTATVSFSGWNGATAPAASEHGESIYGIATSAGTPVATLTADGVIAFKQSSIFRFMKARVSAATTLTLDVDMKRIRYT